MRTNSRIDAKQIADLLTLSRIGAALGLACLGVAEERESLSPTVGLLLYSWTSDTLDGEFARRSRVQYRTWLGDHDLEVDVLVSAGLLVWLVAAGYTDPRLATIYAIVWALIFARLGVPRSLGMLVQAPVYAWFIAISLRDAPSAGIWLVIWIAAAIALTWPRFSDEIVPEFLEGMRAVWRQVRSGES